MLTAAHKSGPEASLWALVSSAPFVRVELGASLLRVEVKCRDFGTNTIKKDSFHPPRLSRVAALRAASSSCPAGSATNHDCDASTAEPTCFCSFFPGIARGRRPCSCFQVCFAGGRAEQVLNVKHACGLCSDMFFSWRMRHA